MFLYNLIDFVNQISLLRAVMKAILEIAATFSAVWASARFLNNFAWAEAQLRLLENWISAIRV